MKIFWGMFLWALTATAATPQILSIGNGAEPKDLDPHIVTGVPEAHLMQALFEPLVSKDPKTLEPVPGIAESWTKSKDGKVYTFKLRDSKWSNGDPLTAEDFVYSWTRLLTPATASEYAYQGYYFKNGRAFNTKKITDPSQLGFKAKDAHTLEVTLEDPTPFFLGLLFHHSLNPVPRKAIEKFGGRWTRPENFVSNGTFTLQKWELNKIITLVKNPNYWDAARVALSQVNYYPVDNMATEERMFRSKELQITEEVPLEKIPTWQKDSSGVYHQAPYLGTYFYWLNVTKPPLNNKFLRKALALSFDREQIVKNVTRGGQLPGTVFTPPGTAGYQPTPRLPAKLDASTLKQAKEYLAKAGYPEGKGLPPMEILYNTHEGHKKIAEALQEMWKKNLGIDVKLFNQEWKVYLDNQAQKNFTLSRAGWIGDYNDPNTFLDMLTTGNVGNHSGWSNKVYDDLIARAEKETNAKKRLSLFSQAEDLLLEELPVLPIYIYTRVYLRRPEVAGWYDNIEDIHPLKWVSLNVKP